MPRFRIDQIENVASRSMWI